MSMITREEAWRIFAKELNDTTLELEGEEERAPSYLVTPLGAKINRVYAVGVLTETENVGTPEEPMWRARVTDPTGTFFVTAGQYQPDVSTAIANIEPPLFVAVVGKASSYSPDEETFLTSIRAEIFKEVTEDQRDHWILEAARSLKERLEMAYEASKMEEVTAEEMMNLGFEERLVEGIKLASEHYPSYPIDKYERMLEDALRYVLPEYDEGSLEVETEETEGGKTEEEIDDTVLEIIEEEEEKASDEENGVGYEQVREEVVEKTEIGSDQFEESVKRLKSDGKIYEPVLGNLKRIY